MKPQLVILRLPKVIQTTGLSRSTIYAQMSKGNFPKPVRPTGKSVGWRVEDIYQWLKDRGETILAIATGK